MCRWPAGTRILVVCLTTVLAVGAMTPLAGAATGDVTEFPLSTPAVLPQGIVTGSDGALWFAERNGNAIGRLKDGVLAGYTLPIPGSAPFWVASGPDGNVWFTERTGNRIGRITPSGVFTEFAIPTASSQPAEITAGPDDALWFTEQSGNRIGRITIAGEITEFTLPHPSSGPFGIIEGPDAAMWFTERSGNRIGRITTGGQITEFPIPLSGRLPSDIATGSDGNLWFTEPGGNAIGRMSTAGTLDEFVVPTALPNLMGISPGPDGTMWFTEIGGNNIGRITLDGTITEFPLPNPNSQPFAIAAGLDGAMWFTEQSGNRIGRMDVTAAPPMDTTPPTVAIASPADGSVYPVGQIVAADYTCTDEAGGSGLSSCDGPVASGDPIDTSLGTHTFTVTATDVAGNEADASTTYVVVPPPDTTPPDVTIASPPDGAVYAVGQVIPADYVCADGIGGSGLATCDGPVANGDPIDTSLGTHTFTVTATDVAGNQAILTTSYTVLRDLGGSLIPIPTWNAATAGSALTFSFDMGTAAVAARTKPGARHEKPGGPGTDTVAGLFAPGSPESHEVRCDDPAIATGPSRSPQIDAQVTNDGRFHLVWKSEKSWAGTCRALVLRFDLPGWRDAPLTFLVSFS